MSGPIVLITGANSGLGLASVKALAESAVAYQILVGVRSVHRGEEAIKTVRSEFPRTKSTLSTLQVDITKDEDIDRAVGDVASRYGKLDVLLNNAGAVFDTEVESGRMTTRQAWNAAWDVNVVGPHVMAEKFAKLLLKSSDPRLIFITSGTASLTETENFTHPLLARSNASPEAGWPKDPAIVRYPAYRTVKCGLNMMMREWVRLLKMDGVKVWSVSPGYLATGLGGKGAEELKKLGAKDPSVGAHFLKTVIEGERDHEAGKAIRESAVQVW